MTSPTQGTPVPVIPTPVQGLVAPQTPPTGTLRNADQTPLIAKPDEPEDARVEPTTSAVTQSAVSQRAGELPALRDRSVSASENPEPARSGTSRMQVGPDAAAFKEASDGELIAAILTMRDTAKTNLDLKRSDWIVQLSTDLLTHTFSLASISTTNIAKVLVALTELPDLQAGDLPEQIEQALTARIQLMPPDELTELAATLINVRLEASTRAAVVICGNRFVTQCMVAAMAGASDGSAEKVSKEMDAARRLCNALVPYEGNANIQGNFDDAALVERLGGMFKHNSPFIKPLRDAFHGKRLKGRDGGGADSVKHETALSTAFARWSPLATAAEKHETKNVKLALAVFEEAHSQLLLATAARAPSAKLTVKGHEGKVP